MEDTEPELFPAREMSVAIPITPATVKIALKKNYALNLQVKGIGCRPDVYFTLSSQSWHKQPKKSKESFTR